LSQCLDRLLLDKVGRVSLFNELLRSDEGRGYKTKIEGLSGATQKNRIDVSVLARILARISNALSTVWTLPHRISQFVKRIDDLEKTSAALTARVEALERTIANLKARSDS